MRQSQLWNKCAVRADSVHVRHAIVDVNVVIGVFVVHSELLVVMLDFVLIAENRSHCFHVEFP